MQLKQDTIGPLTAMLYNAQCNIMSAKIPDEFELFRILNCSGVILYICQKTIKNCNYQIKKIHTKKKSPLLE